MKAILTNAVYLPADVVRTCMYKHHPNPEEINVLVVDPDESVFESVQDCLKHGKRASYHVQWEPDMLEFKDEFIGNGSQVVFLDLAKRPQESRKWVQSMAENDAHVPVVLLSVTDSNLNESFTNIEERICEDAVAEVISKSQMDTATVERAISHVLHHLDVENELEKDEEKLDLMLNTIDESVVSLDKDLKIISMNMAAEKIISVDTISAEGEYFFNLFNFVEDLTNQSLEKKIRTRIANEESFRFGPDVYLINREYNKIYVEANFAPIVHLRQVTGYLVIINDEFQKRQWVRKLTFQNSHDMLTGLVNRMGFESRLQQSIRIAEEGETQHVLIYIDLDQFKVVNETSGHAIGDEVIRQFASKLERHIRKRDTFARIGGDEFALLVWNCSLEEGEILAQDLLEKISNFRFAWGERVHSLTASLGLTLVDAKTSSWAEALSMADTACCMAKENGRNRIEAANSEGDNQVAQRQGEMEWVTRLVQAVDDQGLELYYQAIVPVDHQSIESHLTDCLHYEVLVRYRGQDGIQFGPGMFLPAAERYNVIGLVDRWVVKSTLLWLSENAEHCKKVELCSINLSGATLNDDKMIAYIKAMFSQTLVDPAKICFEVTETAAISHLTKASRFIKELRRMGCRFALDDFGSGMSSFAYLKHMPVDFVKIDGSFVRNIVEDEIDRAMVKSINEIGQIMEKKTIAEFCENAEILGMLKLIGVDYVQGYHISKPVRIGDPFRLPDEGELS